MMGKTDKGGVRRMKQAIALLLALTTALGLIGCGGKSFEETMRGAAQLALRLQLA